jgi:hypothetical protein
MSLRRRDMGSHKLQSIATQIIFAICLVSVVVPLLTWVSDFNLPITTDLLCSDANCTISSPVSVTLDGIVASQMSDLILFDDDGIHPENIGPGRVLYPYGDIDIPCAIFPDGSSAERACNHHDLMKKFIITVLVFNIASVVCSFIMMMHHVTGSFEAVVESGYEYVVRPVLNLRCFSIVRYVLAPLEGLTPDIRKLTKQARASRGKHVFGLAAFQWLLVLLSAVFWETYLVGHSQGGIGDTRASGPVPIYDFVWDGRTIVSQGFGYGCIYMLEYYLWAATAVSTILFASTRHGVFNAGDAALHAVKSSELVPGPSHKPLSGIQLMDLKLQAPRPGMTGSRRARGMTVRDNLLAK